MKFFREIAAYLSIALLALANMGAYVNGSVQIAPPTDLHQESRLTIATDGVPLYCLTDQRFSVGAGQGNSASTFKHPFVWAAMKTAFLNAQQISGVQYYHLSKYLLIGFETTDVIYPFHQFW
ncbi:MAG: hypothetical protein IPM82_23735 [Saprospiraceae bacterium]|nr:hypothetical protein [Saprospiraceae bacterium]